LGVHCTSKQKREVIVLKYWSWWAAGRKDKIYCLIFTFYYKDKTEIKKNFGDTEETVGGGGRSPLLFPFYTCFAMRQLPNA